MNKKLSKERIDLVEISIQYNRFFDNLICKLDVSLLLVSAELLHNMIDVITIVVTCYTGYIIYRILTKLRGYQGQIVKFINRSVKRTIIFDNDINTLEKRKVPAMFNYLKSNIQGDQKVPVHLIFNKYRL